MRGLRILRVAQKLYPEYPGGGTYHVHAMSRDQAAMGHDVTVLTMSPDDTLPRREERAGYTVIRRTSTVEVVGNELSVGVARFLRAAEDFDVVHAHSHLYFSTNLAALTRRFGDTPLAITNHGLYSQNAPEWLFDAYLRTVGRWTFDSADVVFCYTDTDERRVRDLGVTTDIEVVPNGVDTSRFTPEGPTSDLIEHGGPVVLFVGRLVEGKRPQDAVDAVSRLPEELDAKLYVVGDGPMRDELETRGGGEVEFLGHVPYDEMPAVYRAGDVVILPSRAEGLPRTVLEALASGVSVVVSDLEQVAPIVEGVGRTVSVGDVGGFADALNQILIGPDTHDSRKKIEGEYDWMNTVEQTTATLRRL